MHADCDSIYQRRQEHHSDKISESSNDIADSKYTFPQNSPRASSQSDDTAGFLEFSVGFCGLVDRMLSGMPGRAASSTSRRGSTFKWSALLFGLIVLEGIHCGAAGNLVKQFVSSGKDNARSIESYKDSDTSHSTPDGFDVGAILCEKYNDWSSWSSCSRKCEQTRVRRCRRQEECGKSWIKEKRTCMRPKGSCSPLTYKVIGTQRRNRMIEELLYDLLYHKWSEWGPCTRSCRQKRQRRCKYLEVCENSYIQEERRCQISGSLCEHRYSLKAVGKGEAAGQEGNGQDNADDDDDEDDDDEGDEVVDNLVGSETVPVGGARSTESPARILSEGLSAISQQDNVLDSRPPGAVVVEDQRRVVSNEIEPRRDRNSSSWNKLFPPPRRKLRNERRRRKPNQGKWPSSLGREFIQAQRSCGFRPTQGSRTYRVVGGREVIKNSWPWQVAILTRFKEQYCGGTLIAPRWVLTAAHCVRKKGKRRRLTVRVGEHDIDEFDPTQQDLRPEKEFPHPDFDYNTITNDIALIKLRNPPASFTLPGYACLPDQNYHPPRDTLCSIVGWGKLKNTHLYGSDTLQEAKVPVVRHRRCQKVFTYTITKKQLCAGYKKGGIDSCAGDSGGPLLCPDRSVNGTDRFVLNGVTSYGEGCGRKGKYGIYTKVSSYLEWIYKTIGDNR